MSGARSTRRLMAFAPLMAIFLAGCGDGSGGTGVITTSTAGPPRTEGTDVPFTAPPTAPTPTVAPSTTTTTEAVGLPETFPVPANGILTLGGTSTMVQTVGIRGVPADEVHAWLVEGVASAGYTITADAADRVEFTGDGLSGTAEIIPAEDEITVRISLGAPS